MIRYQVLCLTLALCACTGADGQDNRLAVADACTQAANAETTLAAEIRAGRLNAAQLNQVAVAKGIADALCLDQAVVADSAALSQRLRDVVPRLVSLISPE